MNTYTVTLTAAGGGRNPHAFRGIEADTAQAAIVIAYRERHGDHVKVTTRDVHARGNDISDTRFSVFGTAGAVTFADVERTDDTANAYTDYTAPGFYDCCGLPKSQGAHSNYCPTVQAQKVWRCAGGSGSGLAKRGDHGFIEVFRSDVDAERAAGTELLRIVL